MNLLVLCTDTFRADYLGCYGNDWVKTPNLDRLASQGVRFNDFYGEGLPTIPSRRAFYTGRTVFPFRYIPQKSDRVQLPGWHPLFEEDITLAEWLGGHGYTTGLVSDLYHLMKPGKNFHRGFDSWQWIRGQETDKLVPTPTADADTSNYARPDIPADAEKRVVMSQYLNNRAHWKDESDHFAAQVMQEANRWLENYGHKKPWMLWVESFDPHEPWDAPQEFLEMYSTDYDGIEPIWAGAKTDDHTDEEFARIKAQYAGECSHVDKWCGSVIDTLDRLGLKDETIVVFTSDHGCMMGEQSEIHKGGDRCRIQVTRSPLIIRHPDKAYAGTVTDGFAQQHDLMPTLLGLLGKDVPDRCNGVDFWPMVTQEQKAGVRDVVISAFGWHAAIRTKEWVLVTPWVNDPPENMRGPELYDRQSDPEELVNVFDQHPETAKELQVHLDQIFVDHPEAERTMAELKSHTPAAIPGVRW